MSLECIAGSSGAGKSHRIYRELIEESIAHPERQFFVIVPEQFTMQTQKEIVRMHPRHGLLNVDILSFNRLAWRVFSEVGGNTLPILEETGKSLIVQRMATRCRRNLRVLGKTMSRQGAVSQLKSLISELLQYGISPEELGAWRAGEGDSLLSRKLEDVEILYRAFGAYLEDHYLTNEEIPEVLAGVIGESALLRGSHIVFDGFTGFTPLQYKVLRELLCHADRIQVLVTMDPAVDPMKKTGAHQLFAMSTEMIRRLYDLAGETGTELLSLRRVMPTEKSRFSKSPALHFLEQHLFRYHREIWSEETDEISLFEGADPAEEIRHVASEILRQIREEGRDFRDFAVLAGDLETYGEEAAALFEAEGIPCFLDHKRTVLGNMLIEGIRAALQMVARSYSYESVFRYLRSGLSSLSREETDELENYVLALGVRGRKRYAEVWEKLPRRGDPERLPYLNALREKLMRETEELHAGLHDRGGTVRTKTEALTAFLRGLNAEEKLLAMAERLREDDDVVGAKEYEQIYGAVTDLLEKVGAILGEEKSGIAAFAELLDAGFSELRIGTIPPGENQVMIGDIERTRLRKTEVIFFVGVNEGIVPKPVQSGGILSESDRERLRDARIVLAPTPREEIYRQRFYLYLAMTRASHALCLSYARTGKDGKTLLPSYLIAVVEKLFPGVQIRKQTEPPVRDLETATQRRARVHRIFQELSRQDADDQEKELLLWMSSDPQGHKLLERCLAAAESHRTEGSIGRRIAEELYGRELVNSATRLESFAGCAFRHFCEYGLRLKEREVFSLSPADVGSVLHMALEKFSLQLRDSEQSWRGMDDQTRGALADAALQEAVGSYRNELFYSSGRNSFFIQDMRELMHRTVWALQKQIEHGEFIPSDFEFSFHGDLPGTSLRLSENAGMRLTGRIDRVDLCDRGEKEYIKIIDYKTGKTTFDLNLLLHGLQLQLVLYLNAAVESERKRHPEKVVEPAGVFYYHVDDPILSDEEELGHSGDSEAVREQKILEKLRPDGRCRSEEEILLLLDRELADAQRSRVIPVERRKDGGFLKSAKVCDGGDFLAMSAYARWKTEELGERIMSGETAVSPYLYGDRNACTYCSFCGVCGFDPLLPGNEYRQLRKSSADEVLMRMKTQAAAGCAEGQE